MSGIVWIASYPKSGSTWFRVLLANFLRNSCEPADINSLDSWYCTGRAAIDDVLGVESGDLSDEELIRLRPHVYRQLAAESTETQYWKIHDAFSSVIHGGSPIPFDVSLGAVYLVRNPLDIAVSYAHHRRRNVDSIIRSMGEEDSCRQFPSEEIDFRLREEQRSWTNHVLSWLDQDAVPVHMIRYEDLVAAPVETFTKAINFLKLPDDHERITRSVSFSLFDVLRTQEKLRGFRERPPRLQPFFRNGMVGEWCITLSREHVRQVVTDHGAVMRQLGYSV